MKMQIFAATLSGFAPGNRNGAKREREEDRDQDDRQDSGCAAVAGDRISMRHRLVTG